MKLQYLDMGTSFVKRHFDDLECFNLSTTLASSPGTGFNFSWSFDNVDTQMFNAHEFETKLPRTLSHAKCELNKYIYRRSGNFRGKNNFKFFAHLIFAAWWFRNEARTRVFNFCAFNFHRPSNWRKFFNGENFPIYGIHACSSQWFVKWWSWHLTQGGTLVFFREVGSGLRSLQVYTLNSGSLKVYLISSNI